MPECAIAGVPRWNQRLPTKTTKRGPIWPFPFTRLQAFKYWHSILKAIPGLKITTDTFANETNISSLVTKFGKNSANSGLVAIMAITFLCAISAKFHLGSLESSQEATEVLEALPSCICIHNSIYAC